MTVLFLACHHQLMEIENVDRTRFNILRQDCRSVAEGVDWLRQNRGRFRRPIYEPLILSVWDKVGILCTSANRPTLQLNMKNLEMAKYLENRVSFNDMSAFFCEDKEDMNQLMRILRDEMRLHGINVVHAPPSDEPSTVEFLPRIAISELRFVYSRILGVSILISLCFQRLWLPFLFAWTFHRSRTRHSIPLPQLRCAQHSCRK